MAEQSKRSTDSGSASPLLSFPQSTTTPPASSRPRLLPQNRKLRHLKRVTLHNLLLGRPRRPLLRAADDAAALALTSNFASSPPSSPSRPKRSPKQENLHRSSEDPAIEFEDNPNEHGSAETPGIDKGKGRAAPTPSNSPPTNPLGGRRWSLALGGEEVGSRQRRAVLKQAVESGLADVFYSLHCAALEEPVYVSEVVERSTSFNFGVLDLTQQHPSISRSHHAVVKVWARRVHHQNWFLLIRDSVDLRALSFLGTDPNPPYALPPNTLLLHLADGAYSLDVPASRIRPSWAKPPRNQADPVPMAPYGTLMRLSTLENSVQDVLSSQAEVAAQVEEVLCRSPPNELPAREDSVCRAKGYVAQQERAVRALERKRDELCASLLAREEAIRQGRQAAERAAANVADAREKLESSRQLLAQAKEQIRGQRRRICTDLSSIFPITSDRDNPAPLAFRICGLCLPNTTYESSTARAVNEDALSAALGLTALLTNQLQYYLSAPLPYPITTALGSRAVIRDDISLLGDPSSRGHAYLSSKPSQPRQREFPLHLPRGGSTAGHFRFDYGWFLLNKDVEALCASQGLRVVDIRHTLPNLQYLMYVCTAGSDEVPERKRGGVRGLWTTKFRDRMSAAGLSVPEVDGVGSIASGSSRPGSADSEAPAPAGQAGQLRKVLGRIASETAASSSPGDEQAASEAGTAALPPPPLPPPPPPPPPALPSGVDSTGSTVVGTSPSDLHSPLKLPFEDSPRLTFRTRGLRGDHGG